jgi:hypothetical protein
VNATTKITLGDTVLHSGTSAVPRRVKRHGAIYGLYLEHPSDGGMLFLFLDDCGARRRRDSNDLLLGGGQHFVVDLGLARTDPTSWP